MYGHHNEVTKCNKIVLPVRAALERAVNVSPNPVVRKVKRCLRRNSGIIFKKQWWNGKSNKQVTSPWWRGWQRQLMKEAQAGA